MPQISFFHFLFAWFFVCVVFGSDVRACVATKVFSSLLIEIEFGWGVREVAMVGTKKLEGRS